MSDHYVRGRLCATKAHRRTKSSVQLCCIRDEGRPLEAAIQVEASNRRKLRWLRAGVVSVTEKAGHDPVR
jgi:hypothetical protein